MGTTTAKAKLHGMLKALQVDRRRQGRELTHQAVEPSCLAILAHRNDQTADLESMLHAIEHIQNKDGSWSAFDGDDSEGC